MPGFRKRYGSRFGRRFGFKRKRSGRKFSGRRYVKPSRSYKRTRRIASAVCNRRTETKFVGLEISEEIMPTNTVPLLGNTSFSIFPMNIPKGTTNSTRIGSMVYSVGVQARMNITNQYSFPVYCRIMGLWLRNPVLGTGAISVREWLTSDVTRERIEPDGTAAELNNFHYNNKDFRMMYNDTFVLQPEASSKDDWYFRQKNIWFKTGRKLTFDDQVGTGDNTPNGNLLYIVLMCGRTKDISTSTVEGQGVQLKVEASLRHYFKDG